MAINIHHTYSTQVTCIFCSEEGIPLRYNDTGTMDDIAERACEILIKHNFVSVDICAQDSGELLMFIEQS